MSWEWKVEFCSCCQSGTQCLPCFVYHVHVHVVCVNTTIHVHVVCVRRYDCTCCCVHMTRDVYCCTLNLHLWMAGSSGVAPLGWSDYTRPGTGNTGMVRIYQNWDWFPAFSYNEKQVRNFHSLKIVLLFSRQEILLMTLDLVIIT